MLNLRAEVVIIIVIIIIIVVVVVVFIIITIIIIIIIIIKSSNFRLTKITGRHVRIEFTRSRIVNSLNISPLNTRAYLHATRRLIRRRLSVWMSQTCKVS